ncbi:MAG: GNAT family N-acetyltransferase [Bacteroidetes bacterium]|nr:MAG: GNAT family N-acetyltransferase [Bacteroidota bacterium]
MSTIATKTFDAISGYMGKSFLEDPMNKAQLEGINQKEKLMRANARLAIKHASKIDALHMLNNDPRAIMIAFDSENNNKIREAWTNIRTIGSTFFTISFKEVIRLFRNMKVLVKVLDFKWPREFVNGRHYRVKVISIDKSLRGTGAFRKLITPAIEYADQEQIPMVLETHNPSNVGLYEHFGFKLMKTISSPDTDVQQYCMIREPLQVGIPAMPPIPKAKPEKKRELWPRMEMMI